MPDGVPILRQTEHGATIAWGGLSFYPSPDPKEYARRKARVFSPRPETLFFVPSVGLGYGLADLLEQLPPRSAILCVEARQEVMALAEAAGLPQDPRLLVVRTDRVEAVAEALRRLGGSGFRRVVRQTLCAGYRLAAAVYDRLQAFIEEEIRRYWQNRLTLIALGGLQVRNLLSNIAALPGAGDLAGLRTDAPIVVVGAGPSLDRSLPVMLRLRSRFALVAVDTAVPALRAAGLRPDLVVALEAQAANLQDFVGWADDGHARIACDLSAHPDLTRLFPGRLSLFSSAFAPLRLFGRLEQAGLLPCPLPALGSVGVTAVSAALRLTPSWVFLTGLDFSYPGGRTHARGSTWHLAMLAAAGRERPVGQAAFASLAARPRLTVAGKGGTPVRTDTLLRSYRDNLEAELAGAGDRVSDLGREGLGTGAVPISDRDFQERLCRSSGSPASAAGPAFRAEPGTRFPEAAVVRFLASEKEALDRAADAATGRPGVEQKELARLLQEVDYAWIHFPDVPDLEKPDPGFLARAAAAARWHSRRLERLRSVLGGLQDSQEG